MAYFDNGDDDAFGELVYEEEEEFEQELENRQKQDPNCTSTQEEEEERLQQEGASGNILPELSDDDEELVDDGKENDDGQHEQHDRDNNNMEQQMAARKRGPPGIFSDFSPIDWHLHIGDAEQLAKRRRIELEAVVERATARILSSRRQHQKQQQRDGLNDLAQKDFVPSQIAVPKTKLLRVPPMNGQIWWGINSVDGTFRRYLGTRRPTKDSAAANVKRMDATKFENADAALAKLIQAEESVHEREQQRQQQQRLRNNQSVRMEIDGSHSTPRAGKDASKFALWADKYAPNTFLGLLTEDETNRIVLLWLRLWDDYVFDNRGSKKGTSRHPIAQRSASANQSSLWDTLEERDRTLFEMERPKGTDNRIPKQKILALFGPSGVGKSSLARVAALQAGYRPVIIQISELLNVAELKSRLENANDSTSIDALFHHLSVSPPSSSSTEPPSHIGTRPCCFIVDAIEQATSEMIQFLCSWVRRSRGSSAVRRRPVICTCASLWHAPSLRELRANCLPVRVQRCNRQRMQRRLEQICHFEGVRIGRDQLDELFLSHGSDIRLCLNTLQFFSTCKTRVAADCANKTAAFVGVGAIDQKVSSVPSPLNSAVTVPLFDTLSAIFTLDFHADNRGIVRPLPLRSHTLQALFGQMSSEDFVRLMQLVFNNFASVLKLNMAQCRFVSALFTQLDTLQTLLQRAQHFVLARYIPFALAFVHFHCALHVSRRLQFNLAVQPFVEQQREHRQVMRSLRASVVTSVARHIGLVDLFTWFTPLLWLVLQPPVKPSLWSDGGGDGNEQRLMIQRVVELMRAFRISFVRTTGADGMARFAFEPAFDSLVHFPAYVSIALSSSNKNNNTTTTMHLISEPVKQYIAQQLEHAPPATIGTDETQQQIVQPQQHQQQQRMEQDQTIDDVPRNGEDRRSDQSHQNWMTNQRPTSSPSSSYSVQQPLFTFRHSIGSSHAVRREIRIGTLFSIFQK